MKTAAAYIRVSTDDQTELSPDSQLKLIKEYAKKNDMLLLNEYIFQDDGISGRTASKRPAFNRMIGLAKTKPKPFDVILLWKFSRFARNREDSIVYKSMLRKELGIDVISITENLGDDKMAILVEALIEAMDEYYSVNLAEEVKRGMAEKFSRGQLVSSPPFGYDAVNGKLVVNEQEAALVKRIFDEAIRGKPAVRIAKELNAEGCKNKRGNPFDNRGITYILTNPVYNGKLRWSTEKASKNRYHNAENTRIIDSDHERIVDDITFKKAVNIVENNKHIYGYYGKQQPADYVFKSLVRCHSCGATLVRSKDGMQCHAYAKGQCATSHYISFTKLHQSVINYLENSLHSSDLNVERTRKKSNDIAAYERQLRNEKNKLERVKSAFENGIDTIEEYKENKARLMQSIEMLETKIKQNPIDEFDLEAFKNKIRVGLETLQRNSVSAAEKNSILHQFIKKIIYNINEKNVSIYFKD